MKKLLAILLTLTMIIPVFSTVAMADGQTVEISFCVGDKELTINGEKVTVEKPYVVGEGVTLVPLRVITEAFGAKVEWIGETKTIKLDYPDVNIVLQIANPTAEVNGKAEALLSAPELTNGFTMVPLRFISETFGAEVGYDNTTKRITVTKTNEVDGTIVTGGITSEYIGDSYYNWMMKNPVDAAMSYRQFDGSYTEFEYDEDNYFYIEIYGVPEDYDSEEDFADSKEKLQGLTLVKAEKTEENGAIRTHFQARDKKGFFNAIRVVTDKYVFDLAGWIGSENTEEKEEILGVMSSFALGFNNENTSDLSTVKDGWRGFKADALNLSLNIPAEWVLVSDEDAETDFIFAASDVNDNVSRLHISAYSKSSVTGAKELAESDFAMNKRTINEGITTFTNVNDQNHTGFSSYGYTFEIAATNYKQFNKDIFFEKGDYVYNISIAVKDKQRDYVSKIINSIKVSAPDSGKLGEILRNLPEEKQGKVEVEFGRGTINIPKNFEQIGQSENGKTYMHKTNGTLMTITAFADKQATSYNIKSSMYDFEEEVRARKGTSVIYKTTTIPLGRNSVTTLTWKENDGKNVTYNEGYILGKDSWVYNVMVIYSEIAYSEAARTEVRGAVTSINLN